MNCVVCEYTANLIIKGRKIDIAMCKKCFSNPQIEKFIKEYTKGRK